MRFSEKFLDNYATALMHLAIERKKINEYLQVSNMVIDLFRQYPEYVKLLSNKDISKEERKEIIKKTFSKEKFDELIMNAFYLLIDREAFSTIRVIFKRLRKLINAKNDVQYGKIYSVEPLSNQQIKQVQMKLEKKYGYHIELVNKIDPDILGGVRIKLKHDIIDGSLAGQLQAMREKALSNK